MNNNQKFLSCLYMLFEMLYPPICICMSVSEDMKTCSESSLYRFNEPNCSDSFEFLIENEIIPIRTTPLYPNSRQHVCKNKLSKVRTKLN